MYLKFIDYNFGQLINIFYLKLVIIIGNQKLLFRKLFDWFSLGIWVTFDQKRWMNWVTCTSSKNVESLSTNCVEGARGTSFAIPLYKILKRVSQPSMLQCLREHRFYMKTRYFISLLEFFILCVLPIIEGILYLTFLKSDHFAFIFVHVKLVYFLFT